MSELLIVITIDAMHIYIYNTKLQKKKIFFNINRFFLLHLTFYHSKLHFHPFGGLTNDCTGSTFVAKKFNMY